jgi:hypothetical protein
MYNPIHPSTTLLLHPSTFGSPTYIHPPPRTKEPTQQAACACCSWVCPPPATSSSPPLHQIPPSCSNLGSQTMRRTPTTRIKQEPILDPSIHPSIHALSITRSPATLFFFFFLDRGQATQISRQAAPAPAPASASVGQTRKGRGGQVGGTELHNTRQAQPGGAKQSGHQVRREQ